MWPVGRLGTGCFVVDRGLELVRAGCTPCRRRPSEQQASRNSATSMPEPPAEQTTSEPFAAVRNARAVVGQRSSRLRRDGAGSMTCRVSRHRIPLSSGTQSMWKLTPYRSARTVMRAKSGSPPSLGKDLGNRPQGTVTIVSVQTKSGLSLLFVLWSGRRARLSAIRFRTMRCRIGSYTVRFTGGGPGMSSMDSPAIDDTLMIFTSPGGPDRRTS